MLSYTETVEQSRAREMGDCAKTQNPITSNRSPSSSDSASRYPSPASKLFVVPDERFKRVCVMASDTLDKSNVSLGNVQSVSKQQTTSASVTSSSSMTSQSTSQHNTTPPTPLDGKMLPPPVPRSGSSSKSTQVESDARDSKLFDDATRGIDIC